MSILFHPAAAACVISAFLCADAPKEPAAGGKTPAEPAVRIRFAALLPGSTNPKLEGKFHLDLRIYLSPQGGEPIWREERDVDVKEGRIDLTLGQSRGIPMKVHEATFKFLGVSVNGRREVYPRYAIVNVVYATPKEALAGIARRAAETRDEASAKTAVSAETRAALTWSDALAAARAAGGDLPGYEEWYGAMEACAPEKVGDRTGHYEWVLPWVYDPASHGRLNEYFRGRFQGCDYMDLSPGNKYPFRIATPRSAKRAASP